MTTTPTTHSLIHSRALLVWLTISTWSARKYDRKISAEVNRAHNASPDAGRYNKFLLPGDAPTYRALTALAGSIRAAHYANTLAWSDEGWRLLPVENYMTYTTWFRAQQQSLDLARSAFLAEYPLMKSIASQNLSGLYNDADYPTVQDIRQRFTINVEFTPIPDNGDLRVSLAADQVSLIESSINDRIANATKTAVADAWSRLHGVVSKVVDRLASPDAIFRDSLIANVRDVCDVLGRLNVTNDPDLEAMRACVSRELTHFDPDELRDTPSLRAAVAEQAMQIMDQMSVFYDAPARREGVVV